MLRLTLAQMLKLIAFCAVGLAVPALLRSVRVPATVTGHPSWSVVASQSLLVIPTLWALMALLVVRPDRGRDRLFWGLLLVPLSQLLVTVMILTGLAVHEALTVTGDGWYVASTLVVAAPILLGWVTASRQLRRAGSKGASRRPARPLDGTTPES